jgi:hypothetical protein
LTAEGAHVACSRGRHSCAIHTIGSLRLVEKLPEANRLVALDVSPRSLDCSCGAKSRISQPRSAVSTQTCYFSSFERKGKNEPFQTTIFTRSMSSSKQLKSRQPS